MKDVRRIVDSIRLDGVKRTPQGGIRVDAAIARTGVLVYRQPDGSEIREYCPPDQLFREDSMATLASAPVTKLHPPEMITKANYQKYAKGHVGEAVRQDGDKVVATVYVQDGDLVDAVERGDMREASAGYLCDLLVQPGTTPEGERYDRMQTNRRYNHVAIVPLGRAGSSVALRLDAADNVIPPEVKSMHKERIDGVDYDVGTDAHRAAVERRDAQLKADRDSREKLQARADSLDPLQAKYDAAAAKLATLEKAETARARAGLESSARKVLGEKEKFDGKSEAEIKRAVAAKGSPELRLDGKSDAYVEVLFDMAVAKADKESGDLAALRIDAEHVSAGGGAVERSDASPDVESERNKMIERGRSRWQPKKG